MQQKFRRYIFLFFIRIYVFAIYSHGRWVKAVERKKQITLKELSNVSGCLRFPWGYQGPTCRQWHSSMPVQFPYGFYYYPYHIYLVPWGILEFGQKNARRPSKNIFLPIAWQKKKWMRPEDPIRFSSPLWGLNGTEDNRRYSSCSAMRRKEAASRNYRVTEFRVKKMPG